MPHRQRYRTKQAYLFPRIVQRKQGDEPAFRWLVGSLESGIEPQDSELILSGSEEKSYYLEREQFRMDKEGVIWRVSSSDPDRPLIPRSLRQEVMSPIHDIPSSGHRGVQRTQAKAREMFYC